MARAIIAAFLRGVWVTVVAYDIIGVAFILLYPHARLCGL